MTGQCTVASLLHECAGCGGGVSTAGVRKQMAGSQGQGHLRGQDAKLLPLLDFPQDGRLDLQGRQLPIVRLRAPCLGLGRGWTEEQSKWGRGGGAPDRRKLWLTKLCCFPGSTPVYGPRATTKYLGSVPLDSHRADPTGPWAQCP